jgi:hypothetical protein
MKLTVTIEARGKTYTERLIFPNQSLIWNDEEPDLRDAARAKVDRVLDEAAKWEWDLARRKGRIA